MADTKPGDGGADSLEQYWKRGKGAMRILWGAPGDFTRCQRQLSKHVTPEAANRICAQWHIDMNGYATGSKLNRPHD